MTDALHLARTTGSPAPPDGNDQGGRGFALGVAAYAMWGLFPLYWPLLDPAGPVEVLAHRVVWSVVVMGALLVLSRRTAQLRAILHDRRKRTLLALAAFTITLNWGGYIYGVTTGHVVETALGYFINPLVTVLLGVVVLGERLRRLQWVALALALLAVVGLAVEYGRPPWIALLLAFSFGSYGLLKKKAGVEAVESLTYETMVVAPFALAYLVVLGVRGEGHFLGHGAGHVALLVSTGLVTALPLICFSGAAIRVSMTTIGLLQYLTPTIQFVLGVTVLGETMTSGRYVGFVLVWCALAIFVAESLHHHHRSGRAQAGESQVQPGTLRSAQ